jgi:hypothetical protein
MFDIKKIIIAALCISYLTGCTVNRAPHGWLPLRGNVDREPYGGWLYVELTTSGKERIVQGEFIGIQDTNLILLGGNGTQTVPISRDITYASLKINDDSQTEYALWTVAGIVATPFATGFYTALLWPVWLFGGFGSTIAESSSGAFVKSDPKEVWWRSITPYSRFPQGIPENVDVGSLRPK